MRNRHPRTLGAMIVMIHGDVKVWKRFPHHWPFNVWEKSTYAQWPVNSPHKRPIRRSFDVCPVVNLNFSIEQTVVSPVNWHAVALMWRHRNGQQRYVTRLSCKISCQERNLRNNGYWNIRRGPDHVYGIMQHSVPVAAKKIISYRNNKLKNFGRHVSHFLPSNQVTLLKLLPFPVLFVCQQHCSPWNSAN